MPSLTSRGSLICPKAEAKTSRHGRTTSCKLFLPFHFIRHTRQAHVDLIQGRECLRHGTNRNPLEHLTIPRKPIVRSHATRTNPMKKSSPPVIHGRAAFFH